MFGNVLTIHYIQYGRVILLSFFERFFQLPISCLYLSVEKRDMQWWIKDILTLFFKSVLTHQSVIQLLSNWKHGTTESGILIVDRDTISYIILKVYWNGKLIHVRVARNKIVCELLSVLISLLVSFQDVKSFILECLHHNITRQCFVLYFACNVTDPMVRNVV